eukprot:GFKZ01011454.1.p1 GENE.GFKZ01011454.1~~GFKZ01011454.1.p1  ORF type:complete len:347 (+),score=36.68 GFKZ01011454.1:315-1355(+)
MNITFITSPPTRPVIQPGRAFHNATLRPLKRVTRRRPRVICATNDMNQTPESDDGDEDPEFSRRVFLAGMSISSLITAGLGYRFFIGEDVESRIKSRITSRFPELFPREPLPDERRLPINLAFAEKYFQALESVAVQMQILSAVVLHREEELVRERAFNLFFEGRTANRTLADPYWLNFVLYSRLHVISQRTSPQSRLDFVDRLSMQTLKLLEIALIPLDKEDARLHSGRWLAGLQDLLDEFVKLGWISGFRIEDFDSGTGSAWQDEGRASLTVYVFDPVTIQAAQLIGEEQYEEISPKLSGWMKAYLTALGISVSYEDYYLDDTYRPDPEQFKPSQLATQFDLSL